MSEIIVRYYAGMVERAGVEEESYPVPSSLGQLQSAIVDRHGESMRLPLSACSFLIDGDAQSDANAKITAQQRVEVLPPFAGG